MQAKESALSLISFLEFSMRGGDDDIGIAEGNHDLSGDLASGKDIGIAEEAKKEEKKKEPKKKKEKKVKKIDQKKLDFMPDCLRHVEALVQNLDQSYTDEHLSDVLHSTCIHEKEFPLTQSDGFKHKQACDEFADVLVAARDENLKDGTISGYTKFCERYYEHISGHAEPVKAESHLERKEEGNKWWPIVIVGVLVLVC